MSGKIGNHHAVTARGAVHLAHDASFAGDRRAKEQVPVTSRAAHRHTAIQHHLLDALGVLSHESVGDPPPPIREHDPPLRFGPPIGAPPIRLHRFGGVAALVLAPVLPCAPVE